MKLSIGRTGTELTAYILASIIDTSKRNTRNGSKASTANAAQGVSGSIKTQEGGSVKGDFENRSSIDVNDAEYERLAQEPEKNRERLQQMVNQAAKNAGYTVKAMHGTPEGGFTVFDHTKSRYDRIDESANYFTDSNDVAKDLSEEASDKRRKIGKVIGRFLTKDSTPVAVFRHIGGAMQKVFKDMVNRPYVSSSFC